MSSTPHGLGASSWRDGPGDPITEGLEHEIERLVALLYVTTGRDFSDYRANQIWRRMERRMAIHGLIDASDYVRFLEANPQEQEFLAGELLIGVTQFFRDPDAWAALRDQLSPRFQNRELASTGVRAWVVGCSTGEEAYSLAILLGKMAAELRPDDEIPLKIFATDLDPSAIEVARRGRYSSGIAGEISEECLDECFLPEEGGYRIRPEVRQRVTFARHDVLRDPPFKRLDLISCRNLLIYLRPERQKQLLRLFHYSLAPAGILFLGKAETTGTLSELFNPGDWTSRIYRRGRGALRISKVLPPRRPRPDLPSADPDESEAAPNLKSLADTFLLERFAPAAVLVNAAGDILYVNGEVGKYLEQPTGKTDWNVHALANPALRHALNRALMQALRDWAPVTVAAGGPPGEGESATLHPISGLGPLRDLVMIVFGPRSARAAATMSVPSPWRTPVFAPPSAFASARFATWTVPDPGKDGASDDGADCHWRA